MRIGAVVISDRRDLYLPDCLASFDQHVPAGLISQRYLIDDRDHTLGLAGAVQEAWAWALGEGFDYLLHVEEDFRFVAPVPLVEMVTILWYAPRLAQVVLKRQPWSPEEARAGGIMEMHPDLYEEQSFGPGCEFVEHRRIFSLNPCLVPRRALAMGWPDGNEAGFTDRCVEAGLSFAFYGRRDDAPRVMHVGAVRGTGWRL